MKYMNDTMRQNENTVIEVIAWVLLPIYIVVMVILTAAIGVKKVE